MESVQNAISYLIFILDDKRQQIDAVRKQMNENELLREKEDRIRKELEVWMQLHFQKLIANVYLIK